jgi:hypothetical protein
MPHIDFAPDGAESHIVHEMNDIVALARHAAMSTSYKPALLKALVRIIRRSRSLEIPLERIGAEFVRLYWVQTVVFHLRQAATLEREPEVVRAIRSAAEVHRVRVLEDLPAGARDALEHDIVRILKINVLDAFHRSMPPAAPPLFFWTRGSASIVLSADAVAFIRANASVLESLANLWWARYLEKVNMLAPLVIEKVERNGAERVSLARFLKLLRQLDGPRCFYCDEEFGNGSSVHVDHVIPWSFLLADPLWDLVFACAACNIAKSDRLPKPEFLDRLVVTGLRRAQVTLPVGFASPMLERSEIERYYNAALSVQWPSGWFPPSRGRNL